MEEHSSSANFFRNFPRQKKVLCVWSTIHIPRFYVVRQLSRYEDMEDIFRNLLSSRYRVDIFKRHDSECRNTQNNEFNDMIIFFLNDIIIFS